MYSASKHAVKGFTDALRIEIMEAKWSVSVTLIKPAGIATPFAEHARNYTDKDAKVPSPLYDTQDVADAILFAATHPRRDLFVGSMAQGHSMIGKFLPKIGDVIGKSFFHKKQLRDEPPRFLDDSLYSSEGNSRIYGDHKVEMVHRSLTNQLNLHPNLKRGLVAAGGIGTAFKVSGLLKKTGKDTYAS